MRVTFDGVFLGEGRGGDETFLRGLLAGLALRADPADRFEVLTPNGVLPPEVAFAPAFTASAIRRRPGPWHFTRTLPAQLRRARPDILVAVTHGPVGSPIPVALTVGDLSFEHRRRDYPPATAFRLRTLVRRQARDASVVLVPSEFTRADVVASYGVAPEAVRVVPNRVTAPARLDAGTMAEADAWLATRGVRAPFLLYLGNLHPRKNVPLLIRSFLRAQRANADLRGHQLVIAGGRWFRGDDEKEAAAGSGQVVFLGRVSDSVRSRLLGGASAVAYLSLFEGFGLPPLEAMAHGTPVLTSLATSLPEVCGNAALLVDPLDGEAVTAGVVRILTDEALRERLRVAGPARAAEFDTERVGTAAVDALRWGLARGPARRR
ncbi:glycosyltransferase family 4 protein [Actinopolymorpha singaporensis]|uniref:Glycosyltransferase involved in cell wall bisynthesis n=1 Tax=Actinopolymorpha singaporensis TaxID=117157 RepID=A0A1H1UQW0_9ACTN|nr:glycosyltransferase family 1 protein [Actinopolymorpha singaporensis]SDS74875.1 Glycosyltransferase involved in cell wall bisynthesis [Actinopolymorpha singaporensis]